MLFNSFPFIFVFLPILWLGFHTFRKASRTRWAILWLVMGSLFFYGYWHPLYVPLLGTRISRLTSEHAAKRKCLLAFGLVFNLGLLSYFKYTNWLVDTTNAALNTGLIVPEIVLPIGISFFTFQQVAYLIDCHRRLVTEYDLPRYALFCKLLPAADRRANSPSH